MRSTENQNAAFGFSIYKNLKNGVIKDLFSFTNENILIHYKKSKKSYIKVKRRK